jgi:DNA repair protein RadC
MKDHEILPIRRDDTPAETPAEIIRPRKSSTLEARARLPIDRTTRLVADVLGTSLERAVDVLQTLGGLEGLAFASEPDLFGVSLPRHRARLVRAAFELARVSVGARPQIGQRLAAAADVWTHMRARLAGLPVEEFWVIGLDVRHRVLLDQAAARGSLTGVEVHPRDFCRVLIKAGAAAAIFCHNHPSGDPTPSRQDIELTTRLREVGDMCGISVLDHVVVGVSGYASLAERGWR